MEGGMGMIWDDVGVEAGPLVNVYVYVYEL